MNVNGNHQKKENSPISSVASLAGKATSQLNSRLGKLADGLSKLIRQWETTTSLRKRRLQVGSVFVVVVVLWLVHFIRLFTQPIEQPASSTPQVILSTQRPPGLPPARQPGLPGKPQPQNNQ